MPRRSCTSPPARSATTCASSSRAWGWRLFQRHARGVALTAEGRKLADAAGSALADVDGVLRSLRLARDDSDRIRITTLHSLTYTWLTAAPARLRRAHPQLRLSVDTEIALTRFDDGGPDLGIRHGPGHWPGLTAHFLMDEALFPVASPSYPGLERITRGRARRAAAADLRPLAPRLARLVPRRRRAWRQARRAPDFQRHHRCDECCRLSAWASRWRVRASSLPTSTAIGCGACPGRH